MPEEVKSEEEPKDLGLHHYRVSVILVGLNHFTIMANSPEEAQNKVMNGDGGRPAGAEGPTDFMALVHDRSDLNPNGVPTMDKVLSTLQHAVMLQNQMAQQKMKSKKITPIGAGA